MSKGNLAQQNPQFGTCEKIFEKPIESLWMDRVEDWRLEHVLMEVDGSDHEFIPFQIVVDL